MSSTSILQGILVDAERSASNFELDQIAFLISHADAAGLVDGRALVASCLCLQSLYEDCRKEQSPTPRPKVMLMCSDWRNRPDHVGRVAECLIQSARS